MTQDRTVRTLLGICAAVLVLFALYHARAILAPVAFSLFFIAIAGPLQSQLETRLPKLLALVVTVLALLFVVSTLAYLLIWAFGLIGRWMFANAGRLQFLYLQTTGWLELYGISVAQQFADNFNVNWLLRTMQNVGGRTSHLHLVHRPRLRLHAARPPRSGPRAPEYRSA